MDWGNRDVEIIREFTHNGRPCRVVQHGRIGHYMGYTQTTLTATDALKNIPVHGGITYGPDDEGWVGFDCNHAFDICVDADGCVVNDWEMRAVDDSETTVWSPDDVADEVKKLADYLDTHEESL